MEGHHCVAVGMEAQVHYTHAFSLSRCQQRPAATVTATAAACVSRPRHPIRCRAYPSASTSAQTMHFAVPSYACICKQADQHQLRTWVGTTQRGAVAGNHVERTASRPRCRQRRSWDSHNLLVSTVAHALDSSSSTAGNKTVTHLESQLTASSVAPLIHSASEDVAAAADINPPSTSRDRQSWVKPRVAQNPNIHGRRVTRAPQHYSTPVTDTHSHIDPESPAVGHDQRSQGLGIVDYLRGKHIFITGATGFLAKVLVEKILREQPQVGHLYLLIQPRHNKSPEQRLHDDVLNSRLFDVLRTKHGDSYLEFMRSRLTAVPGNVTTTGLGIGPQLSLDIASKIDVIVHSAATTNFHEQYHKALELNTLGPCNVLKFGKSCPRLQVFLHVSTAYVNGTRQGVTPEMPFQMGDSIAKEKTGGSGCSSASRLDAKSEIEDAYRMLQDKRHEDSQTLARIMVDMGLQRAKKQGWQDTYVFTKAMGEMLLNEERGNVPVAIMRPSIVESTLSQPFPGWIEGHRMVDPLITGYGKGQLTGFLCEPESILDVVPCDMVVNATLAAMVKHSRQPGLAVYQVASSHKNPLFLKHFFRIVHDYFVEHPLLNVEEAPLKGELRLFSFFPNLMLFKLFLLLTFTLPLQVRFVMDNWVEAARTLASSEKRARYLKRFGRISKACEQYEQMAVVYEPYGFYRSRFGSTNSVKLHSELSEEEQADFGFDTSKIEWRHYLCSIHVPGLRQYVMNGRFD